MFRRQYTTFTKQRDELLERRDELNTSAESIEELIEVLDMRKDEAIERTFKQVSKNFTEVFEKLVPAGKGRLIMQKREEQVCLSLRTKIRSELTFSHDSLTRQWTRMKMPLVAPEWRAIPESPFVSRSIRSRTKD